MTLPDVPLADFDLSDVEFWTAPRDYRDGAFKTLRDTPGLVFYEEALIEDSPFPRGPGYYALSRHEDIWQVSRNANLFCSGKGSNIGDLPQEMNEFFGSMINMDDPKHFRLRSIVSKGFTPEGGRPGRGRTSGSRRPRSSTGCSSSSPTSSATSSSTSPPPSPSRSSAT